MTSADRVRRRFQWLGALAVVTVVAVGWAWTLPGTLSIRPRGRTLLDEVRSSGQPQLGGAVESLRRLDAEGDAAATGAVVSADRSYSLALPEGWELEARSGGTVRARSASGTLEVAYPATVTEVPGGPVERLTVDGSPATMSSDGVTATVVAKLTGGYLFVRFSSPGLDLDTVRELVASIRLTSRS